MDSMGSVLQVAALIFPLLAQSNSDDFGRFHGTVVDSAGGAVRAIVRVFQQPTGTAILRFHATNSGAFDTDPLPAGVYSLTFFSPGFRRRDLRNVAIEAGRTTSLGEIKLEFSGCDAPGMNCDHFGAVPESVKRIIAEGNVILKLRCVADLDRKSKPVCPGHDGAIRAPSADVGLAQENSTVYLVAENGAALSTAQPPTSDCSHATYGNTRLPVAGLGLGVDFCVRTKRGSFAHVFFTDEVENLGTALSLRYSTRTR
jgi:hypothetical protein